MVFPKTSNTQVKLAHTAEQASRLLKKYAAIVTEIGNWDKANTTQIGGRLKIS